MPCVYAVRTLCCHTGLFSAAIMESGSCDEYDFFLDMDYATTFGYSYSAGCGCSQTGGELQPPSVTDWTVGLSWLWC